MMHLRFVRSFLAVICVSTLSPVISLAGTPVQQGNIQKHDDASNFKTAYSWLGSKNPQDKERERILVEKVANEGDAITQGAFAATICKDDPKNAVYLWIKSAQQGNSLSEFFLGLSYATGIGIPPDGQKAIYWLKKSDAQENPDAELLLGRIYLQGYGVPQDSQEAAKWLSKSAKQNNADAELLLGRLYAIGDGVPHDPKKALFFIHQSASQGNDHAQKILTKLETLTKKID